MLIEIYLMLNHAEPHLTSVQCTACKPKNYHVTYAMLTSPDKADTAVPGC